MFPLSSLPPSLLPTFPLLKLIHPFYSTSSRRRISKATSRTGAAFLLLVQVSLPRSVGRSVGRSVSSSQLTLKFTRLNVEALDGDREELICLPEREDQHRRQAQKEQCGGKRHEKCLTLLGQEMHAVRSGMQPRRNNTYIHNLILNTGKGPFLVMERGWPNLLLG